MAWTVVEGPIEHAEPGYDGRGWLWGLREGDQFRRVFVQISGTALAVRGGVASDTKAAMLTRGASEVDKILHLAEPPRMIGCTTVGCGPVETE